MTHSTLVAMSVALITLGVACAPEGDERSESEDGGRGITVADAAAPLPNAPSTDGAAGAPMNGALNDAGILDAGSQRDAGRTQDGGSVAPSVDGGNRVDAGAASASDAGPGGTTVARPSAGCGKSGRPSGGRVEMQGKHNYTFPTTYDGMRPLPLLIGFHAAGNPIGHIEGLTNGSDFETSYVRAFPKSKENEWIYDTDIGLINAMYDDLMANYCIDMSRVFATGNSSGAQMIVQILLPAHKADADHLNFKAVAPNAASRYGTVSRAIPVLYIQAQLDTVRNSSGADVVKEFVTANGCAMTTKPYTMTPSCMSMSDRRQVMSGCIQYDGCKVPTVWCSHNDPFYGTSYHGWPCFATKTMSDFFAALP